MSNSIGNNKVVKAGAGYIIGNYLLKGITFLSTPIFTRLMTTKEFGQFGTYTSYEAIFYIIIGLALHSSITNAKYKYEDKYEEYISSITLLSCISTVVWLVIANIFFNTYSGLLQLSRPIVNILILHCFGSAMIEFYNIYVSLNYSVKSFMKITSINALSNMGLSVFLLVTLFRDYRLMGRIIGAALPIFCIAIYITMYFFKRNKPVIKKDYWKFGLQYSLPIIPHGISQVILASFDRIMISNMIGSVEAGLYSFATAINALVVVVSNSLDKVWKPWFYEKMDAEEYDEIKKQGSNYMFGMALFTALVIMVVPEIIKILGDKEYWHTTSCVVPVIIGGYFSFIYMLPVLVEYFYSKTKYIAIGTMAAAALNLVLNYMAIPRFGYIAAAYTTFISYVLYFLFHFILAAKIHGKSLFSGWRVLLTGCGIVLVGIVAIVFEKYIIIRWILECCLGLYSLYWANKKFGLLGIIKKKIA